MLMVYQKDDDSKSKHPTMDEHAPLRPYDGIRLLGPSVAANDTVDRFVLCSLCDQRAKFRTMRPKFLKFGRGLRDHLNQAHADLTTEVRARILVESDSNIILDCEAFMLERLTAGGRAPSREASLPVAPNASVQLSLHPVLAAARDGKLSDIIDWLNSQKKEVDVSSIFDKRGSGALHWAAGGGHLDVVEWMLQRELDPCMRTQRTRLARNDGKTPLHWAARNGHINVINYLLSQGVPCDSPMLDRTRPFDLAVFGSHVPAAALLAHTPYQQPDSYDGDWRTMRNDHLCTIAHWCGMGAQRACATWLMHHRVPFDVVQKEAQTPLHKAAAKKNYDTLALIARYLLSSIVQCTTIDAASADLHAKVQELLVELNEHDLSVSPGDADRVVDSSILSNCAACSTHASNPFALPVQAPTIPGQCVGDMITYLRAHMNELDTSGLTALQVALAQGMHDSHPAVRLLSVLN